MYNAKEKDLYFMGNRMAPTEITYGCEDGKFRWGWSTGKMGHYCGWSEKYASNWRHLVSFSLLQLHLDNG